MEVYGDFLCPRVLMRLYLLEWLSWLMLYTPFLPWLLTLRAFLWVSQKKKKKKRRQGTLSPEGHGKKCKCYLGAKGRSEILFLSHKPYWDGHFAVTCVGTEVQCSSRVRDGAEREEASRDHPLETFWPPVETDSEEGCFLVIFSVGRQ